MAPIDTTGLAAIKRGLRAYLLDTETRAGATLRAHLGERFWWDRVPDSAPAGLYALAQLQGAPPEPEYSDERMNPQLVLQLIARQTADVAALEAAGDVVEQLMRGVLSESTGTEGETPGSGLVWARSHYRASVPRPTDGPLAGLTIEYHRTSLVIWPAYLFRHGA